MTKKQAKVGGEGGFQPELDFTDEKSKGRN